MGFIAAPQVPFEVFILHFLFLMLAFYVGKRVTKILDRPYPWITLEYVRQDLQYDLDNDELDPPMRRHLVVFWFHSKIIKFFIAFCAVQLLLVAHALTDKCRWSQVALKLAEHYKSVDLESRPNVNPFMCYESFFALSLYFVAVNSASGYFIHQITSAFRQQVIDGNYPVVRSCILPFIAFWLFLTYMVLSYSRDYETSFLMLFKNDSYVEM